MSSDRPVQIRIAGGRLGYDGPAVLEAVELEVRQGEFLAVVGPNGTGKTTLLRAILGVLPLQAGSRTVDGRLGYSPQRSALDPIYPFTAAEVVAMGLLGEADRAVSPEEGAQRVAAALDACGVQNLADTPLRDLSGGQKQRVLVARALVPGPDVLVLDEPTNDLDLRGEHEVMELLSKLNAEGRTVIMVTHLLHLVATYAERLAFIHDGGLRTGSAADMLTAESLETLFGTRVVVGEVDGRRVIAPYREAASE